MKYEGIEEYKGNSGYLMVEFDEELHDQGHILIFLDSVETEESVDGKFVSVSSDERSYEDISFDFSDAEDALFVNAMHVESIGCAGVVEFVEELLKQKDSMDKVDTLLPVVVGLLKKKRCPWAKPKSKKATNE